MPKISIIVPVYNVEPYLRKCLDSLLAQTLKDIEIILIDDGSTDASDEICDEYARNDARIRIIHKSNEGLSCARNDGIDMSTAPYLMFVDSDDWVDPRFCEIPYKVANSYDADLVVFQYYRVKNGKFHKRVINSLTGMIDTETAIKSGGTFPWNKLYKKELFNSIRYPEGRVCEGVAVTHKVLIAAKRITMIPDILYYWVYRKNSISNSKTVYFSQDAFSSALQRAEDLRAYGCAQDIYERYLYSSALGLLGRAYPSDDPVFKQAEDVVDSIKRIPSELRLKKKAMLLVWKTDKRLFHFICRALGQKDRL